MTASRARLGLVSLLIFLVAVSSTFLWVWRDSLLCTALRWHLERVLVDEPGVSIDYRSFSQHGSALELEGLVLRRHEGDVVLMDISIDHLVVNCSWCFSSRPAILSARMDRPNVELIRRDDEPLTYAWLLERFKGNRFVDARLDWRELGVSLVRYDQGRLLSHRVAADGQWCGGKGQEYVSASVQLGKRRVDADRFDFLLRRAEGRSWLAFLHSKAVDLRDVVALADFFSLSTEPWKVQRGTLTGAFSVCCDRWLRPRAMEGEMRLGDLQFVSHAVGLRGNFEEIVLAANQASVDEEGVDATQGSVELVGDTSLVWYREGSPYWQLEHFTGGMFFDSLNDFKVALGAKSNLQEEEGALKVEGRLDLFDGGNAVTALNFALLPDNRTEVTARLQASMEQGYLEYIDVALDNCRALEWRALQSIVGAYLPAVHAINVHGGTLSTNFRVDLAEGQPQRLKLIRTEGEQLRCEHEGLGIVANLGAVSGSATVNLLADNPLETMSATLAVTQAELALDSLDDPRWTLRDGMTTISVTDGVVTESTLSGEIAGFSGELQCDWSLPHEIVKLCFTGSTADLVTLSPRPLSPDAVADLGDERLQVTASVAKKSGRLSLDGVVQVVDAGQSVESLRFGCELGHIESSIWGDRAVGRAIARRWRRAEEQRGQYLPVVATVGIAYERRWLRAHAGIAGFVIREGWLDGSNLRLRRFVSPFLFPEAPVVLDGRASLTGSFDLGGVAFEYRASDVCLSGPTYEFRAPVVEDACQYLSMADPSFGVVPLAGVHYRMTNRDLDVMNLSGDLLMTGSLLRMPHCEAECEGMQFAGSLQVDLRDPDPESYLVDVDFDRIEGTVPDLQQLLKHFGSWRCLSRPMGGTVRARGNAGRMSFRFEGGECEREIALNASLSHGRLAMFAGASVIENLNASLRYDLSQDRLDVADLDGTILLCDVENRRYQIGGPGLCFSPLSSGSWSVDVQCSDELGELCRLVGESTAVEGQSGWQHFAFDLSQSHFTDLEVAEAHLLLDESLIPQDFLWRGAFSFHAAWNRYAPLLRWGSRDWQIREHDERLATLFEITRFELVNLFVRRHVGGTVDFDVRSPSIAFRGDCYTPFSVKGRITPSTWAVEQCEVGNVTIACDLQPEGEKIKIAFAGVDLPPLGFAGAEGELMPKQGECALNVNLLEMDIEHASLVLPEYPLWERLAASGELRGSGVVRLTMRDDLTVAVTARMEVDGENLSLAGWTGGAFRDALVTYAEGLWNVEGVTSFLYWPGIEGACPQLQIGQFTYGGGEAAVVRDLQYNVPAVHLPKMTETLSSLFSDEVPSELWKWVKSSKDEGNFSGWVSFTTGSQWAARGTLADDTYRWCDVSHAIRNAAFVADSGIVRMAMRYRYLEEEHGLLIGYRPGEREGALQLFDLPPMVVEHPPSRFSEWQELFAYVDFLTVNWRNDALSGVVVDRVEGRFSGVSADLRGRPDEADPLYHFLDGTVSLDWPLAACLFTETIVEPARRWRIGGSYRWLGSWRLPRDELSAAEFSGQLVGEACSAKGYLVDKLQAEVAFTPSRVEVTELQISDPAGMGYVPQLSCWKNGDASWYAEGALARVRDFRPSLVQRAGELRGDGSKPLMIPLAELREFSGTLGDVSTFTGQGFLDFTNHSRRAVQNTLLAIPADIIARIGLDLDVLNPVSGKIRYHLGDGKIYLDKFQDVYSEGRVSKFYLPKGYESWVDFDGGLSVKVRMKQYNLIFKLAELFTVTIQGNLTKPSYTVQKQPTNIVEGDTSEEVPAG